MREGLELAQRAGARSHEGWLTGSIGDVAAPLGRLEEAEAHQRRAIALAIEVGDEPLHGMRLTALAWALLAQGRLEEAEAIHREAVPILHANPEPQSLLFIPYFEGFFAMIRREDGEAADRFAEAIAILRDYNVENSPEVFPSMVRALLRVGRTREAEDYRDLSTHGKSPHARANAALVEGLLASDPSEARSRLAQGVAELERLGLPIDAARGMVDLARAMSRTGEDPRPTLERTREILIECDALAFVFEVDDAIAELGG